MPPSGGYPGGPYQGGGMPPAGGQRPFSVGDAFGYGWKKFTENVGSILIAMLVFALIGAVLYGVDALLQYLISPDTTVVQGDNGLVVTRSAGLAGGVLSLAFFLIYLVWEAVLRGAFARGGLRLASGQALNLSELLTLNRVGRIIGAGIIMGLVLIIPVILGFILCIIPGIIVAAVGPLMLGYVYWFIIDQDLGVMDSVKATFSFIGENFGSVFLVALLGSLVLLGGFILCGVGLLVAYPIVALAQTYTYKVLRGVPVAP